MIVKHSKRTVRRGCKHCGTKDLYWGHDTSVPGEHCDQCGTDGKWILLNAADETPHSATCGARPAGNDHSPVPESGETTPEAVPAAPAGDAYAAFQALMASLAPKVDRAEVAEMIRAEIGNITVPTRTVVERVSGERREISGAHEKLGDTITMLLAGEHVMMVGPAGTGKSTIAEHAADALDLPFYALSLSPQTSSVAIVGYRTADGTYVRTLFREAYEHGGVFLFDEMDNAHPSVLAVINQALANGKTSFPDGMVRRHPDFRVVAAANTYGRGADRAYVGRQALDAATLDRFAMLTVETDEALEADICKSTGADADTVTKVLTYVRRLRANAADKRMAVVISPRASAGMCRLIAAGMSWDAAVEARLNRGMSAQDWAKLTA